MLTGDFARQIILPSAANQPGFVGDPIRFAANIILIHPALFDICFAFTQIGLGLLILNKKTVKIGLICSIIWGLFVWYFGEGLGGIFGSQSMLIMGAPGAALLYVLLAAGVMVPSQKDEAESDTSNHPSIYLSFVWTLIWMGGGLLLLRSSHGKPGMIAAMLRSAAQGAPGWLAGLDIHLANWFSATGGLALITFLFLYLMIGFLGFLSAWWRAIGISLGIFTALAFWVIGQHFGGLYSGLSTDPNTALLIALLGVAVFGTKEADLKLLLPVSDVND